MMNHTNIKKIQSKDFENDKNKKDVRILQIDFAMSYSCEYQNEIQSALWSRKSVLLFTAASFLNGVCHTYLFCSDSLNKDKNTIFTFLNELYADMYDSDKYQQTAEEIIWSDGPSSEFKNKYMVKLLEILASKYNKPFSWKYFVTSHGKGVVDGVGGNIKRLVRQKTMSQNNIVVQNAEDFANLACKLTNSTKIKYIAETKINDLIKKMKPWEVVPSIPGIRNYHIVKMDENGLKLKNHAMD